jgi:hypothetical protein
MASLSIVSRILAYEDSVTTNNPQQRPFDWTRQLQGIPIDNPACDPYKIPSLQQVEVFDGTRTLGHSGTTQYNITVSPLASNRYRIKWTGTGTAPAFRTARSVTFVIAGPTPPPSTITFTPQTNQSVAVTASAGSVFGDVEDGDVVFIPGLSTGDSASIFDTLNEGYWSVLSATASTLILARFPGEVYSVKAETATVTVDTSFQAFSAVGVQLDDILKLVSGFSPALLQSYEIVAVTDNALEFISGVTLPAVSGVVPGANGVVVFSDAKSFIALETNQNIDISLNGGTVSFPVEPILAGDPAQIGMFQLTGTVYSLIITNKSTQVASVRILSVE